MKKEVLYENNEKTNNNIREISIEGLPMIGRGANGEIYRLDEDKIVKVYNPTTNTLERIQREKQSAKAAFIHDIPSAISYNIIKTDDRYGIIYELVNAQTLGQYITNNPEQLEEYGKKMADLLKKLHSTEFEPGVLPDARKNLQVWVDIAEKSGYYTNEVISKLRNLINNIPFQNTFIHGDFHPGNIMVVNGELMLIDMTDVSVGNPIIELLGSYQIMKLVPQRKGGAERYTGMSNENLSKLWNVFIQEYTGITDKNEQQAYEQKLKFYALIRSLPGITFSELVPKEVLPHLTQEVSKAFLGGYDIVTGIEKSEKDTSETKKSGESQEFNDMER